MSPLDETAASAPSPVPPPAPPPRPPTARRPDGPLRRVNAFLVSPRLAIAILVIVLACCLVGVTVYRGPRAGEMIFSTLWFNGLLTLLAVSSAAAFFSRIWKRKLTLVSVGMIVFHLSFAALLGGVVYNSLFFFRGVIRLTEGETLPNDQPGSYDEAESGRFFDPARLRGETTLVRMHTRYKVDGDDKRAAYEIEVGEGSGKERRIIYVTEYFDFDGVRFFCMKEGYSVLLVMSEKGGREIYGAHVPLQSYQQSESSYLYSSGSAAAPSSFAFPPPPDHPRAEVTVVYWPSPVERAGQVSLEIAAYGSTGELASPKKGLVPVGGKVEGDGLVVSAREIRYWVGMNVRYDPGMTVILASLCLGLVGMTVTFVGRLRQGSARRRAA